jgi:hypothetical protein
MPPDLGFSPIFIRCLKSWAKAQKRAITVIPRLKPGAIQSPCRLKPEGFKLSDLWNLGNKPSFVAASFSQFSAHLGTLYFKNFISLGHRNFSNLGFSPGLKIRTWAKARSKGKPEPRAEARGN